MPAEVIRQNYTGNGSLSLVYDVFTYIPHLKINTEFILFNKNVTELSLGYSPYVMLKDRDVHVLRGKVSESDCKGDAFMIGIASRFYFMNNIFLKGHIDYFYMKAEGREDQYLVGDWIGELDHKVFSKTLTAGLSIGYSFR